MLKKSELLSQPVLNLKNIIVWLVLFRGENTKSECWDKVLTRKTTVGLQWWIDGFSFLHQNCWQCGVILPSVGERYGKR